MASPADLDRLAAELLARSWHWDRRLRMCAAGLALATVGSAVLVLAWALLRNWPAAVASVGTGIVSVLGVGAVRAALGVSRTATDTVRLAEKWRHLYEDAARRAARPS